MKSIKEYVADLAIPLLLAAPLVIPVAFFQYQAHNSGFVQSYNEAVQRNADINGDGQITLTEELRFKQSLVKEIVGLREQGRNLDDIVDWLKVR